jgi:hypothetical protein
MEAFAADLNFRNIMQLKADLYLTGYIIDCPRPTRQLTVASKENDRGKEKRSYCVRPYGGRPEPCST